MRSRLVAADWVAPVVAAPVRNGVVVLEGDRVAWLGRADDLPSRWRGASVDRRRGILTPGLVNAHTHLQYTHFERVGRGRYSSFEHWSDVFGDAYDAVTDPESWRAAALDGIGRATRSGSTVFAEIVTNDAARGALAAGRAAGIEYLEAIGYFDRDWRSGAREDFVAWLDRPSAVRCGVSPHAPYSLDGAVVTDLVGIAAERGMRVHSHLGESSVESELYLSGAAAVLSAYGDLRDEFELVRKGGSGHTTAGYADAIGLLGPATHVAHAIYLSREDRELLLERGTRIALCPRSNAVIGLADAPVAAYLAEGHEVAVGTDSLASSPSLDLMADVAALARLARSQGYAGDDLSERLLTAATVWGARALGLDGEGYGGLAVGGPADLAVFDVPVPDDRVADAFVGAGEGRCVLAIGGGETLHDARRAG